MNSFVVIYTAAILMACVALACTVLCLAWSIPSWRHRLARSSKTTEVSVTKSTELAGWPAHVGNGLVSVGIAGCAAVGWYGCYCVLNALSTAVR